MLFHQLDGFARILVSGPQRSGTRFAAKIIAAELGYKYVDEQEIGFDREDRLASVTNGVPLVVQCPGLCHVLHKIARDHDCVVMMRRPLRDIWESEDRIGWNYEHYEFSKYMKQWGELPPIDNIAGLKYCVWEHQKTLIRNHQDIEYDSLQVHPRWVPKEDRRRFGPHQTEA